MPIRATCFSDFFSIILAQVVSFQHSKPQNHIKSYVVLQQTNKMLSYEARQHVTHFHNCERDMGSLEIPIEIPDHHVTDPPTLLFCTRPEYLHDLLLNSRIEVGHHNEPRETNKNNSNLNRWRKQCALLLPLRSGCNPAKGDAVVDGKQANLKLVTWTTVVLITVTCLRSPSLQGIFKKCNVFGSKSQIFNRWKYSWYWPALSCAFQTVRIPSLSHRAESCSSFANFSNTYIRISFWKYLMKRHESDCDANMK